MINLTLRFNSQVLVLSFLHSLIPMSHNFLASWLHDLVFVLRTSSQNPPENSTENTTDQLWQAIAEYVAGHTVVIAIDDMYLTLNASDDPANLNVIVSPTGTDIEPSFISDSQTLQDVMAGHKSLDRAVGTGKIQILAPLPDLMKIRKLVKQVLTAAQTNTSLQALWQDFAEHFSKSDA